MHRRDHFTLAGIRTAAHRLEAPGGSGSGAAGELILLQLDAKWFHLWRKYRFRILPSATQFECAEIFPPITVGSFGLGADPCSNRFQNCCVSTALTHTSSEVSSDLFRDISKLNFGHVSIGKINSQMRGPSCLPVRHDCSMTLSACASDIPLQRSAGRSCGPSTIFLHFKLTSVLI